MDSIYRNKIQKLTKAELIKEIEELYWYKLFHVELLWKSSWGVNTTKFMVGFMILRWWIFNMQNNPANPTFTDKEIKAISKSNKRNYDAIPTGIL